MIDGFVRMMDVPDDIVGPLNLGNPVETRILELAELIVDLIGSHSRITFRPLPTDDPIQRCPDITQSKALLNWHPWTDLRHGLEQTVAYFDQLLRKRADPSLRPSAVDTPIKGF
jgi:UDP-glucuronate decarboxylase